MEHRGLSRHSLSTARIVRFFLALTLGLLLVVAPAGARTALPQTTDTYTNPLPIQIPAGGHGSELC
jgi:hypothetical protein